MDMMWAWLTSHLITLLVAGYGLMYLKNKITARYLAWSLAIGTITIASSVTTGETPLLRMVSIVMLLLVAMKTVVIVESLQGNRLTWLQWISFAIGWFGMRPALFHTLPSRPLPFRRLIGKGILGIASGWVLVYLSMLLTPSGQNIAGLLLLAGLSLILHFGFLNLSAAWWRMCGVNTSELFRSPLRSRSLKEFWGKRWNIAFSEMTTLVVYRPLKGAVGPGAALTFSFLLSGVLHEIAISLPVQNGYGLPTLYFVIHAFAMRLEKKFPPVQRILAHPILSRVWVVALLLLPLPLLFHTAFINEVLTPLRSLLLRYTLFLPDPCP